MSFSELLQAQSLPIWAILIVSTLATIVLLVTLLLAERSRANGVLAVITLLAVAVAAMLALRPLFPSTGGAETAAQADHRGIAIAGPKQLACLNELAGGHVEAACESALFGSPENVAAAVTYVAAQIDEVSAGGAADTPATLATRRALERDRYGLTAHVLMVRNGCTPSTCAVFRSFSDTARIIGNMNTRTYDGLVGRYMLAWNTKNGGVQTTAAAIAPLGTGEQPGNTPSGIPSTIDFPSAGSIPPVSIMTETTPAPTSSARTESPSGSQSTPPVPQPRPQVRRPAKQVAPPAAASTGPVQLAPTR